MCLIECKICKSSRKTLRKTRIENKERTGKTSKGEERGWKSLEMPELTQGGCDRRCEFGELCEEIESKGETKCCTVECEKGAKRALEKEEAKATVEVTRAASLFASRRGEGVRRRRERRVRERVGWLTKSREFGDFDKGKTEGTDRK